MTDLKKLEKKLHEKAFPTESSNSWKGEVIADDSGEWVGNANNCHVLGIGCHACETCKAEPYMIDENCDTCWNCSHDLGILRWDNNGTPYQI